MRWHSIVNPLSMTLSARSNSTANRPMRKSTLRRRSTASLRKHNTFEALRQFQEAQKLADTWLGRLALGRAYLEAEGYAEASAEFEQCMKRRGEATSVFLDDVPTLHYYPQLLYYTGRAQQGLGSAAAANSYRSFLDIKKKSDPDPQVEDAKRRLSTF